MRQLKISQSITNRESASLEKYLHDIGKVDLITAEEEVILAQKIREGDQVALERLTKQTFALWYRLLSSTKTRALPWAT